MIQYGFPFGIFALLFLGLIALSAFFYWSQIVNGGDPDALGRNFVYSKKRQSYGESHFETPKEYEKRATIESPETAYGMILGQLDDRGKSLISQRLDSKNRGNLHVAVLGSSGSGKTYSLVKPTCFQIVRRRESVIITDPDGGLFRDMATYFQDHGYVVRHFDLTDIRHSDGWDCLKSIDPTSPEDAQMFAQTVIANLTNGEDMNSIYAAGPKALLNALLLRVLLDPKLPPEEKNIETVYSCLQNRAGESYLDNLFFSVEDVEELKPCLGPYLSFKQGSPNLRGNLITNLSIDLQLLQNKSISKLLSTDDIDLELPGKQPCAYFCGFPDNHSTYNFIVSLFFSMLFIKLIHYADVVKHGELDVPVNFLLDEFPSIGRLPDWDRKMATIRKRNMNVIMIFQDIMQFQNIYERSWGTILGNCATLIILGINEKESADLVTKRMGDTTIEAKTEQRAALRSSINNWINAGRDSTGEGRRALVSYDELFKLPEDDEIILFQGHNPILCKKYPFVLHPEAKKLSQFNYDEVPDLYDLEGRAQMRQAEAERIAQYLMNHPLDQDRNYDELYKKKKEDLFTHGKSAMEAANSILSRLRIPDESEEVSSGISFDSEECFFVDVSLNKDLPETEKADQSEPWTPSWRYLTAESSTQECNIGESGGPVGPGPEAARAAPGAAVHMERQPYDPEAAGAASGVAIRSERPPYDPEAVGAAPGAAIRSERRPYDPEAAGAAPGTAIRPYDPEAASGAAVRSERHIYDSEAESVIPGAGIPPNKNWGNPGNGKNAVRTTGSGQRENGTNKYSGRYQFSKGASDGPTIPKKRGTP